MLVSHKTAVVCGRTASNAVFKLIATPAPRKVSVAARKQQHARPFNGSNVQRSRSSQTIVARATKGDSQLQVIPEQQGDNVFKLSVTVPPATVSSCFQKIRDELAKDFGNRNGFRQDTVPLALLVQQVGGQQNFKSAVVEEILMSTFPKAVESYSTKILDGSERIISDVRDMVKAFDPTKPFAYEVTFETKPAIKWVKSYRDIEITVQDTGNMESDVKAADGLIRQYLKDKAQQRVVAGRGLADGDIAVIDMEVRREGDRTPLPGLKKDGFFFDTEQDPLGLRNGMYGMAPGESRTFTIRFPDDWNVELWRGIDAQATVTVQELFSWILPEFDDAFVKRHYPSFESASEMRERLVGITAMERSKHLDREVQDQVVSKIVECVDMLVPDRIVEDLGVAEYQASLMEMLQTQKASMEDVEKMSAPEVVEQYIKSKRRELEDQAKFLLAVDDIFDLEGLTVDPELLQEELAAARKQADQVGQQYDEEGLRRTVEEQAKTSHVMAWLQQNIKVTIQPWQGEGAAEPAAAVAAS